MMGNKSSMIFKNFTLPDVQFHEQPKHTYKLAAGNQKKNIDLGIDIKYNFDTCSLKNQKVLKQDFKFESKQLKSIKILTYNIWFEQPNIQNRIKALIKIIKEADADIICLQEVTNDFIQALWKNSEELCAKGELYIPAVPMSWYDTVILSKFPLNFYKIPFLSSMSRSLLMGTFQLMNQKQEIINCSINCVHLQSLNNEKLRIDQLKVVQKMNKNIDLVFLAGDMNFSDNWKQDLIIQKDYIDVWKQFKQNNQESWTMPQTQRFPKWRPDHILVRNNKTGNQELRKSPHFQAKIQRIGVFTIPPFETEAVEKIVNDQIVRTPSDHMGLLANIRFCL